MERFYDREVTYGARRAIFQRFRLRVRMVWPKIPQVFKVLHMSNIGRVYTVIVVRGEPDAVVKAITDGKDSPQVVDCTASYSGGNIYL